MIYIDISPLDWDKPLIWYKPNTNLLFEVKLITKNLHGKDKMGCLVKTPDYDDFYKLNEDGFMGGTRYIFNYTEIPDKVEIAETEAVSESTPDYGEL